MERWKRLEELRAKAVAKQSMSGASENVTTRSQQDQRPPQPFAGGSSVPGFGAAEPMQSDADLAIDSSGPMDFTSSYIDTLDGENAGATGMAGGVDWTFDDFSFSQGGPSWDMDFNEDAFQIQGLE